MREAVTGRDVGLPPDEEVVEGEQALPVAERGAGHCNLAYPVTSAKYGPDHLPGLPHPERDEDAVYGRRVRVEGQDWLPTVQILGDVDDHAVGP